MMPAVSVKTQGRKWDVEGGGMLQKRDTKRWEKKDGVDLFRQEMWWGVNDSSLHKE